MPLIIWLLAASPYQGRGSEHSAVLSDWIQIQSRPVLRSNGSNTDRDNRNDFISR